ncbi:lipid-A-disaccharide synthase N-terminal domain-containing protein [Candidatus Omnitrophota bacterium]
MYIFGVISVVLFTFCFVPQIISIIKTKNVSGLSVGLWIMVVAGHGTGLVYVMLLKDLILISSYSIGFISSLLILLLIFRYR